MEKKKIGLYIGVAQSFLIMLLVVMFIMLTSEVTKLEGTAKVINYAGVVSGPGEASDNYISNWGNFKNKILGWGDRYKSAMARVVVK